MKKALFILAFAVLPFLSTYALGAEGNETGVKHDLISEKHLEKIESLRKELHSEINALVEKGKSKLASKLTPEQKQKLEELKKKQDKLLEEFKAFWKTGKPSETPEGQHI